MKLIDKMFDGPIDIVGDVHGEIDALETLLDKLGYGENGEHPDGRCLVFLGDLVDRGPDSPAVIAKVMNLVEAGRAQCILGNHEINLLRGDRKHGNAWFTSPESETEHPSRPVRKHEKKMIENFLRSLPLALEREDLRAVHACWDNEAIAEIGRAGAGAQSVLDLYRQYRKQSIHGLEQDGVMRECEAEAEKYGASLRDAAWADPVFLPAHAKVDERFQMGNPIRVLTSGVEGVAREPFWVAGRWRMVERKRWWDEYRDDVPVIVGHYWRKLSDAKHLLKDVFGPDLFEGIEPHRWVGKRRNVYCVDFSVSGRPHERSKGTSESFICQLAALRVPEWEVVHDDHEQVWSIGRPENSD